MKINLNEYDIIKNMLSTIREDVNNEMTNVNSETESENNTSDYDGEDLSAAELSEEQTNFRSTVSPRVNFTGFKVYPKNKNVVFSGEFENMGGLQWEFTLEDANGLYISANNVPFTDDVLNTIKKLKGYYDNWADEWAEKLATEYNRSSDDDYQKSDIA